MENALDIATDDLQKTISCRLAELRRQRGLTSNVRFGEVAGVSRAYLDLIDKGRANFTLKKLVQLAAALDVEPYELLIPLDSEGGPAGR